MSTTTKPARRPIAEIIARMEAIGAERAKGRIVPVPNDAELAREMEELRAEYNAESRRQAEENMIENEVAKRVADAERRARAEERETEIQKRVAARLGR